MKAHITGKFKDNEGKTKMINLLVQVKDPEIIAEIESGNNLTLYTEKDLALSDSIITSIEKKINGIRYIEPHLKRELQTLINCRKKGERK